MKKLLAVITILMLVGCSNESYVKLNVIASTSEMKILTDSKTNIYIEKDGELFPYKRNGKQVNMKDYEAKYEKVSSDSNSHN